MTARRSFASWGLLTGLLAIFFGECLGGLHERWLLVGPGLICVLAGAALQTRRFLRAPPGGERRAGLFLLLASAAIVLALTIYSASQLEALNRRRELAPLLFASWSGLLLGGALTVLFLEVALRRYRHPADVSARAMLDAALSALGVSLVTLSAVALVWGAQLLDRSWDFSAQGANRPSPATRAVVSQLAAELEIAVFYPPANETGELVRRYFRQLAGASPHLRIAEHDFALALQQARERHVLSNGYVSFRTGMLQGQLRVGEERQEAELALKQLDRRTRALLVQLVRPLRIAYATFGHGEGRDSALALGQDADAMGTFISLLTALNLEVRPLGAAEGLAGDVPADASMVVVMGPTAKFHPQETAALARYLRRGGRIFLALDAESAIDMADLLEPLGVRFRPERLVNEKIHFVHTGQPSDRANLASASFVAHSAIHELSQLGNRAPLLLRGAGYFERLEAVPAGAVHWPLVRSPPHSFADTDGDFCFDPAGEQRGVWDIAMALSVREVRDAAGASGAEGRMILVGDSNAFGNDLQDNLGNRTFANDAARWLLGDENLASGVEADEEPRLLLMSDKRQLLFHGSVFGLPLALVALGLVVGSYRRRLWRRRRGAEVRR